jgi:hypothetical protein
MRLSAALPLLAFGVLIGSCSSTVSSRSGEAAAAGKESGQGVEDIYVVRSVRQSRIPATKFCDQARTGFENLRSEDEYVFRSISTRASDGLVVDASVQTVGRAHACFGPTSDPEIIDFYGEGELGGVSFAGRGDCRPTPDQPESRLTWSRCFLDLTKLPQPYLRGRLTSNTVGSPDSLIGEKTDPPGYVQSSIATVRLWKRRP